MIRKRGWLNRIKFKIVSGGIRLFKRPIVTELEFRIKSDMREITPIGSLTPIDFNPKGKRILKLNLEIPKMVLPLVPLNGVCLNGHWFKPATPEEWGILEGDFKDIKLTAWKKI